MAQGLQSYLVWQQESWQRWPPQKRAGSAANLNKPKHLRQTTPGCINMHTGLAITVQTEVLSNKLQSRH
jgi:hypothetical protein